MSWNILCKLASLSFPLVLLSCANVVVPGGGPKDTEASKIISSNPPNYSIGFGARKVELEFNEFIQLDDPSSKVVISPLLSRPADYKVKGKKIIISLPDTLEQNTTYTLNFGESLKDVNEGNVLKNFTYVFSTGEFLDSMVVLGRVIDAFSYQPLGDVVVSLYKDLSDSAVLSKKPFYFTKTDKDGKFSIKNVKEDIYQIIALKDENYNLIYDLPVEKLGFISSTLAVSDSTEPQMIALFERHKDTELQLIQADQLAPGRLIFIYSTAVNKFQVDIIGKRNYADSYLEFESPNDSMLFWYNYNHHWVQELQLVANDTLTDTVEIKQSISPDSIRIASPTLMEAMQKGVPTLLAPGKYLILNFNIPMYIVDEQRIMVYEDSIINKIQPTIIPSSNSRKVILDYPWNSDKRYIVIILDSALTDHYGGTNDTIYTEYYTKSLEEYTSLTLALNDTLKSGTILQLLGENQVVAEEIILSVNQTRVDFNFLNPGDYQIKLIFDENNNGKWDTGNYGKKLQPEKTYVYPEKINLRPNWEVEVELSQ